VKIRARIFGGDPEAIQFKDATEAVGLRLDYGQDKGKKRLPCISTAYTAFQKLGAERYMEMLQGIDCRQMAANGYRFFESANHVWLTKEVPVSYLRKL
jgi:RNA:NAD 2'-phosphotransferase (TPT1/KptA family)